MLRYFTKLQSYLNKSINDNAMMLSTEAAVLLLISVIVAVALYYVFMYVSSSGENVGIKIHDSFSDPLV